jgi:integrase
LRAFANWGVRSGHLEGSFVAGVKFPKVKMRTPRWLEEDEAARLMAAVRDAPGDIRLAITLAMRSGMRLGDIGQLRWQDIRLDKKEIHVIEGKSANPRIIPMHPDIYELIMDWPQQGEAVFPPIRKNCKTLGANVHALGRRCRDWMAKNGFAAGMHSLRHTAATQLASAGATMTDLQEILGHTSQRVTAMYLHSTTGQKAALIARLGSTGQGLPAHGNAAPQPTGKADGSAESSSSAERKARTSNKAARAK